MKTANLNPELVEYFQALSKVAVAEAITATEAIRRALQNFPKATRKDIKHSAAACGIHPLTARNTFDRVRNAK